MNKATQKRSRFANSGCKDSPKAPSRRGSLRSALLAGIVVAVSTAACNTHLRLERSPEFRGITVPLPPPSYRNAEVVEVGFSGEWKDLQKGRAAIWDRRSKTGVLTPIKADGSFAFPPWAVQLRNHCLELTVEDYPITPRTSPSLYGLVVRDGEACDQPTCSPQKDAEGNCLCALPMRNDCFALDQENMVTGQDSSHSAAASTLAGTTGSSG